MPVRHNRQPGEQFRSNSQPDVLAIIWFWDDFTYTLESCLRYIGGIKGWRRQATASEWQRLIEWYDQSMKRDNAMELHDAVQSNESLKEPIDLASMMRTCRLQEDRLRQLRTKMVQDCVKKPADLEKEYEPGLTYDMYVREMLQDACRKCMKAREVFVRGVREAEAKPEAKKNGSSQ